ncbi:MAG: VWA domain-containing protein [Candidatus Schekmanbacteria bacterium]|nr:VWA domain-containing protein [Candidatus Schekmanbacteria bacterium]
MRRSALVPAILLFGIWSLSGRAAAQDDPSAYSLSVDVRLVELTVTAIDRRGRCVANLKQDDFAVFEENQPQRIDVFSPGADTPVDLAYLVDVSGSMALDNQLGLAVWAAKVFIGRLRERDRAAVLAFADAGLETIGDFGTSRQQLARQLDELYAYGKTGLADALATLPGRLPGRSEALRAVVLLTDGLENASNIAMDQALRDAARSEVPFFPIAFARADRDRSGPPRQDLALLEEIARATGGQYHLVGGPAELHVAMRAIEADLRCSYRVGYYPTSLGDRGTFQRVRVVTPGRALRTRTRSGYFR